MSTYYHPPHCFPFPTLTPTFATSSQKERGCATTLLVVLHTLNTTNGGIITGEKAYWLAKPRDHQWAITHRHPETLMHMQWMGPPDHKPSRSGVLQPPAASRSGSCATSYIFMVYYLCSLYTISCCHPCACRSVANFVFITMCIR